MGNDPAQVADQNGIVFTCLRDDEVIKEVYAGSDGLLAGECAKETLKNSALSILYREKSITWL